MFMFTKFLLPPNENYEMDHRNLNTINLGKNVFENISADSQIQLEVYNILRWFLFYKFHKVNLSKFAPLLLNYFPLLHLKKEPWPKYR